MLSRSFSRWKPATQLRSTRGLTTAKPKVLLLDPVNLAHEELANLEREADLIVSALSS